jgi:hypothetical protein
MPRFPMTLSPAEQAETEDEFVDLDFGACAACGSVQLMMLVDPEILYAHAHNTTAHSKTWREHHAALAEFVHAAQMPCAQPIMEVGGASGDLACLLFQHYPNYTILDMAPAMPNSPFPVTQGNCETCVFKAGSALILAHVFEHLYNPTTFITNCARHAVADIFISIPNMSTCDTVPIHVEHTFFVDASDVVRVFATAGYGLKARVDFREHSRFYHMRLTRSGIDHHAKDAVHALSSVHVSSACARKDATVGMMKARQAYFEGLHIPKDAFVAPGGPYGQILYYYTRCGIRGFLDNDKHKQGKRVYGTPHITQPFTMLEGIGAVDVFIYGGPYSNELCEQILSLNFNARVTLLK